MDHVNGKPGRAGNPDDDFIPCQVHSQIATLLTQLLPNSVRLTPLVSQVYQKDEVTVPGRFF
jgi:hypothetical protein